MKSQSVIRLILISLLRRGLRTALLVISVALMVGAVFSAQVIESGVSWGLEQGLDRLGADLLIVPRGQVEDTLKSVIKGQKAPQMVTMSQELKDKIAGLDGVTQVTSQLFLQSLTGASCCSAWAVFLIAFEPKTDFVIRPWLESHPERSLGPDDVLVGNKITFEAGDKLKFYGHEFTIAGKLEPSGLGLDMSVFIPMPGARVMIEESSNKAEKTLDIDPDQVSAIMARLKPEKQGGPKPFKIAYEIERFYPDTSVIRQDTLQRMTRSNISGTVHLLRYAGLTGWVLSAFWIGMVFALAANERRREIGLLRSMGATRSYVSGLIAGEGLFVFGAGGILGLLAAGGVLYGFMGLIVTELEVPFLWTGWRDMAVMGVIMFLLALLSGVLASLVPTYRASMMEPYEAVRTGEL